MMIEKLFQEYIEVTNDILSGVKNGIPVDEFFDKREKIINDIIKLDEDKAYKKRVYTNSGAEEFDKKIVEYIKSEMISTKESIKKVNVNKKMYSSYMNTNTSGNFFRRII